MTALRLAGLIATNPAALFRVGGTEFLLQEGEWSDWVVLDYTIIPHLKSVTGICRFYLMEARPTFRLYVSPVQIDPSNPAMPICTPENYSRELVENVGPFYTQGLPDDTKALDEGVFQDADYISQADLVRTAIGAPPLLLVDEMFAILDRRAAEEFLARVEGEGQIFLATAQEGWLGELRDRQFHVHQVRAGQVRSESRETSSSPPDATG